MSGTDIRKLCIPPYATPAFTSFVIAGQATTIEVGVPLSGVKTFNWTISNGFNVQPNTNAVRDVTNAVYLGTLLPNSGSFVVNIGVIPNTVPMSHSWRGEAVNTLAVPFQSSNFTVTSCYFEFYGPTTVNSTTSAQVRALPNNRPSCAGTTFNLNTGTVEKIFEIAIPATKTLVSVFDATAGFFITGSFTLTTFNVNDAGGTPISYNVYRLNNAVPYAINHVFNILTT
jgi:hypothetical protein